MSIQAGLRHVTRYRYDRRIALGAQTIRLRPAPHTRAKVLAYSLKIEPEEQFLTGSRTRNRTGWRGWCFRRRPITSPSASI